MATREVIYSKGEAGYKAMVADFTEMFDWDMEDSQTNASCTDFKKNCGNNVFVSLRVKKPPSESSMPSVITLVSRNNAIIQSSETKYIAHCAYASGNGFFVLCSSVNALPQQGSNRDLLGISTCRNIVTGESGWLTFMTLSGSSSINYSYQVCSKDTKTSAVNAWSVSTNARIGGAVSLHETATGCVSDKIMLLSAIPDTFSACISLVIFNGTPYTRLGHILVPST